MRFLDKVLTRFIRKAPLPSVYRGPDRLPVDVFENVVRAIAVVASERTRFDSAHQVPENMHCLCMKLFVEFVGPISEKEVCRASLEFRKLVPRLVQPSLI